MRSRIGHCMRKWADRIDDHGAPHLLSWTFTLEDGEGVHLRRDGRGCRLWYLGMDEYEKAHTEADNAVDTYVQGQLRRMAMNGYKW